PARCSPARPACPEASPKPVSQTTEPAPRRRLTSTRDDPGLRKTPVALQIRIGDPDNPGQSETNRYGELAVSRSPESGAKCEPLSPATTDERHRYSFELFWTC